MAVIACKQYARESCCSIIATRGSVEMVPWSCMPSKTHGVLYQARPCMVSTGHDAHDLMHVELTAGMVLGLRDSHCKPVKISTADMKMPRTSVLLWLLLASTTGAICK